MEKNWLIRTKNLHILGPITKEKMKELFLNGSVKGDDEICSGNGYWFFVREKELVERYLLGNIKQDFNPVSEAQNTYLEQKQNAVEMMPSSSDLEFPDVSPVDQKKTELNKVENINQDNVIALKPQINTKKQKMQSDLPFVPVKPKLLAKASENILLFVSLVLVFILVVAFYYRRIIIREFINTKISIFSEAVAADESDSEKKNFLNLNQ